MLNNSHLVLGEKNCPIKNLSYVQGVYSEKFYPFNGRWYAAHTMLKRGYGFPKKDWRHDFIFMKS